MFSIRSWTEAGHPQPFRAVCDGCRENVMTDTEAQRWNWVQHHVCPQPAKVFFIPRQNASPQA